MDPGGAGDGEHCAGPAKIVLQATGKHTRGSFFRAESTLAPRIHRSPANKALAAIRFRRQLQRPRPLAPRTWLRRIRWARRQGRQFARIRVDHHVLAFAPDDHRGGVHQAGNAITPTRMFQALATDVYGPNIGFGLTPRSSPRSHCTGVQPEG
jgi:hypothetical protein